MSDFLAMYTQSSDKRLSEQDAKLFRWSHAKRWYYYIRSLGLLQEAIALLKKATDSQFEDKKSLTNAFSKAIESLRIIFNPPAASIAAYISLLVDNNKLAYDYLSEGLRIEPSHGDCRKLLAHIMGKPDVPEFTFDDGDFFTVGHVPPIAAVPGPDNPFEHLPDDCIIGAILDALPPPAIGTMAQVSKKMHQLCSSNQLWFSKFRSRFTEMFDLLPSEEKPMERYRIAHQMHTAFSEGRLRQESQKIVGAENLLKQDLTSACCMSPWLICVGSGAQFHFLVRGTSEIKFAKVASSPSLDSEAVPHSGDSTVVYDQLPNRKIKFVRGGTEAIGLLTEDGTAELWNFKFNRDLSLPQPDPVKLWSKDGFSDTCSIATIEVESDRTLLTGSRKTGKISLWNMNAYNIGTIEPPVPDAFPAIIPQHFMYPKESFVLYNSPTAAYLSRTDMETLSSAEYCTIPAGSGRDVCWADIAQVILVASTRGLWAHDMRAPPTTIGLIADSSCDFTTCDERRIVSISQGRQADNKNSVTVRVYDIRKWEFARQVYEYKTDDTILSVTMDPDSHFQLAGTQSIETFTSLPTECLVT